MAGQYSAGTMKIVWMDEWVDAEVEFRSGVGFPCLRAIRFRGEWVGLDGPTHVEVTATGLLYRASGARQRFTLRFEARDHRWALETVRDGL